MTIEGDPGIVITGIVLEIRLAGTTTGVLHSVGIQTVPGINTVLVDGA
jgi:hypothetical protein